MVGAGRLSAIDHVELQAQAGIESELKWFYGSVIGLVPCSDVSPPAGNLLRFRSDGLELRISIVETPQVERIACRVFFEVPSLADVMERLVNGGYAVSWFRGLSYTSRRLTAHDPAGNRVALYQRWQRGPF